MIYLISLRIWLGLFIIRASESPPSRQSSQTLRVFADLKHTGTLTGPLPPSSPGPNDFGIAVPLPARSSGRDRWPEKLDTGDPLIERLGRLRVETTKGATDVVVSIESDNRRCLRLFRNADDGWRRLAPGEDDSWTLAPGRDGALEVGVGVVMPEAMPAGGAGPAWPRAFTVLITTNSQHGKGLRVPFRVRAIRHPLGT